MLARRLAALTATSGPGDWRRALVPLPGLALSAAFHRVLVVVAFPDRLAATAPPYLGRAAAMAERAAPSLGRAAAMGEWASPSPDTLAEKAAAGRRGASSLSVVCPARWRFQPAEPLQEVTGQSRSHNSDRIGRLEEEPSGIVGNSSRCSFSSTTYGEPTRGNQARRDATGCDGMRRDRTRHSVSTSEANLSEHHHHTISVNTGDHVGRVSPLRGTGRKRSGL